MQTWIALLRSINVGGRNRVPMAELRSLAGELGWSNARTYIQSGNLAFEAEGDHTSLADTLSAALLRRFGLQLQVVMRTVDELVEARHDNPYVEEAEADPKSVGIYFLSGPTDAAPDPQRSPPDRFTVVGDRIYAHFPNGSARSKLTQKWFERQTERTATARNWRSLGKIIDIAQR